MRPTRTRALILLASLGLVLPACGSDKKSSDTTIAAGAAAAPDTTIPETTAAGTGGTAGADTADTADTTDTTAAGSDTADTAATDCAPDKLTLVNAGKLTVGTDSPAFPPWFADDKPANGKGFESAVAYAIAEKLGFAKEAVSWKIVKFDQSFAPGKKDFDFDINQVSIKDERKAAVDFSDGYYDVNQALVALADSPAAKATTLAELKTAKLGAQQGTTSYDFVKNVIKPDAEPLLYNDNNGAKAALNAKQIDGIVLDLPTAFFVSAVEIEGTKVVGQFETLQGGAQEQFGLVFEKGNPLAACVNSAIAALKSSGELAKIQQAELSDATQAPLIK